MEFYDVLIAGAGLSGLFCARLLAEAGVRVLLIDSKASLDRGVHTTGIFVRRTLESFSLPEAYLGPPIQSVALYSPAGRSVFLESPYVEFRVGRMGGLYLDWLEECRRAGVSIALKTRYIESQAGAKGRLIHLEREGQRLQVEARFIVGADGATSRVARDLGLEQNREMIVGVEEVYSGAGHSPCLHCFLDPQLAPGYLAWVVDDGEEIHLGVAGYAARFEPLQALEQFREKAKRALGLRLSSCHERRSGRIPVGGVLKKLACSQGLLIGDAAGAPSPLTAGGLDPCLRLSRFAASVIMAHLHGDQTALAAYDGSIFRKHFWLRRAMRSTLALISQPWVFEVLLSALALPGFSQLGAKVFFGRGSFPDISLPSMR